jgi:hypothetical protein
VSEFLKYPFSFSRFRQRQTEGKLSAKPVLPQAYRKVSFSSYFSPPSGFCLDPDITRGVPTSKKNATFQNKKLFSSASTVFSIHKSAVVAPRPAKIAFFKAHIP